MDFRKIFRICWTWPIKQFARLFHVWLDCFTPLKLGAAEVCDLWVILVICCHVLCMGVASESRHYNVTSSLIGWAHTGCFPTPPDCGGDKVNRVKREAAEINEVIDEVSWFTCKFEVKYIEDETKLSPFCRSISNNSLVWKCNFITIPVKFVLDDPFDNRLALVQTMACDCSASSHYLNQRWATPLTLKCVTWPLWFDHICHVITVLSITEMSVYLLSIRMSRINT